MNNPRNDKSRGRSAGRGKEGEFQYMLLELGQTSRLIGERQMRLDRIMSYFLSILTAVVGGGIYAAVTAGSENFSWILGLSSVLLTAIGFLALLAMLGIIAEIVSSLSDYYVRRKYFLDAFPEAEKYLGDLSSDKFRRLWRTGFNFFAISLLLTLALLNSIFLYMFLFAVTQPVMVTPAQNIQQVTRLQATTYPLLGIALFVLISQVALIAYYILRSQKQIEKATIALDRKSTRLNSNHN